MERTTRVEIDPPLGEVLACTNDQLTEWSLTVLGNEVRVERPVRVGAPPGS